MIILVILLSIGYIYMQVFPIKDDENKNHF